MRTSNIIYDDGFNKSLQFTLTHCFDLAEWGLERKQELKLIFFMSVWVIDFNPKLG